MKSRSLVIFFGVIICLIHKSNARSRCITPIGAYKPRNRNDVGRYIIDIPGNPKNYVANQRYNVTLKSNPLSRSLRSFKSFMITLESEKAENFADDVNVNQAVGHFEFGNDMLSMFSSVCPNTVLESNALLKTEVQLYWIAPPKNSGCVSIKATVIESRDNWFSEDGPLTKNLCEESTENDDTQPTILKHCCACNEAKYEIAFDGMWTRNTHPRDFPSDVWSTKFSEIIGASHKVDQSFWRYAGIASDGMRDLAETGYTKTLETELKDMSENIRTIIKAKGLQYPNITLTSFAVFRVDNQNHLISVVSKIMPSPDWIVGVSNLELCRPDCKWEEKRTLNLYPWDVGTDDGISYTSSDEPSLPRQPIRRIKPNSPNDPRSPFYDENGEDMKPIARLTLTRQRLYEKTCDEEALMAGNEVEEYSSPCATTSWDEWSPCSQPCGKGEMFRMRRYLNPDNADICSKKLVDKKACYGQTRNCHLDRDDASHENQDAENEVEEEVNEDDRCELGDWSEWSSCSAMCGKGTKTRDRKYKFGRYASFCGESAKNLQENEECDGDGECENYEEPEMDESCRSQENWGEWAACNVTCGTGFKVRFRIINGEDDCANMPHQEIVECYNPSCEGGQFGPLETDNQINDLIIVSQGPVGRVIDCKVTKWTPWSDCKVVSGETCGTGYMQRSRNIMVMSGNGGKPCPKKLMKLKKCTVPCPEEKSRKYSNSKETLPTWGPAEGPTNDDAISDTECTMSPWSAWSPCSTICGGSSFRQRTRYIVHRPEGSTCPSRIMQQRCPLPLACTETGEAQI
ncbi:unnamed protein product [Brassicogethes aeneus]|uniref:Spondin-1 n=1 Tax=Brassicogethes aeneus TaxID=1431903 RepID=A0A9P0FMR1_BRAAE|nr:unnamed protein product [Brassicogethes aeneus]